MPSISKPAKIKKYQTIIPPAVKQFLTLMDKHKLEVSENTST